MLQEMRMPIGVVNQEEAMDYLENISLLEAEEDLQWSAVVEEISEAHREMTVVMIKNKSQL